MAVLENDSPIAIVEQNLAVENDAGGFHRFPKYGQHLILQFGGEILCEADLQHLPLGKPGEAVAQLGQQLGSHPLGERLPVPQPVSRPDRRNNSPGIGKGGLQLRFQPMVDGKIQIEDTGDTLHDLPLHLIGRFQVHDLEIAGRFDGPVRNVPFLVVGNGLKLKTGQDTGDHDRENQAGHQLPHRQLAEYALAPMGEAEKPPRQQASLAGTADLLGTVSIFHGRVRERSILPKPAFSSAESPQVQARSRIVALE